MSLYLICDNVMWQKDYRIPDNTKIIDYITSEQCDPDFFEGNIVAVLSLDGRIFELNLTASIIFEGISQGESEQIILDKMSRIFDVPQEMLINEFNTFVKDLLTSKFIKERT